MKSLCLVLMLWSMRQTTWFWSPPVLATVVKLLVDALALVGAGQRLRSFADVGLIRLARMMLPANGAGVAVLPGQAPTAFTLPAQGS